MIFSLPLLLVFLLSSPPPSPHHHHSDFPPLLSPTFSLCFCQKYNLFLLSSRWGRWKRPLLFSEMCVSHHLKSISSSFHFPSSYFFLFQEEKKRTRNRKRSVRWWWWFWNRFFPFPVYFSIFYRISEEGKNKPCKRWGVSDRETT